MLSILICIGLGVAPVGAQVATAATQDNGSVAMAWTEAERAASANDPTVLIALGAAATARGETDAARALFERALADGDRYMIELASGSWEDSHNLARRGLAMLDTGTFSARKLAGY